MLVFALLRTLMTTWCCRGSLQGQWSGVMAHPEPQWQWRCAETRNPSWRKWPVWKVRQVSLCSALSSSATCWMMWKWMPIVQLSLPIHPPIQVTWIFTMCTEDTKKNKTKSKPLSSRVSCSMGIDIKPHRECGQCWWEVDMECHGMQKRNTSLRLDGKGRFPLEVTFELNRVKERSSYGEG